MIGDVPAEGESTFTRPPEGTGPSENTPLLEPPRPQQTGKYDFQSLQTPHSYLHSMITGGFTVLF